MYIPINTNYIEYELLNVDLNLIKKNICNFSKYKNNVKQFKIHKNMGVIMENHDHKLIKVYSLNELNVLFQNNFKITYFEKEKKHYHAFSCSTTLDSKYFVSRVTFKVSNNIYVNFDTEYHNHCENVKHRIFINYNHEKQQDIEFVQHKINQTIRLLTP